MRSALAALLVFMIMMFVMVAGAPGCNGIIDGNGICIERCPPGTRLIASNCRTEIYSRRTCRQPLPRSLGVLCDYTQCECKHGLLWDEAQRKCVREGQCADQSTVTEKADIFV